MKMKRSLSLILCFLMVFGLLTVSALAAPADKDKAADSKAEEDIIINDMDSTLYNDGSTVFNNYGTVYNNGGVVYNNGGTVYNNTGLVYNNGGTVYNNGAEVYNNGGTVHENGGTVHDNGSAPEKAESSDEKPAEAEEKEEKQDFKITLKEDYTAFAEFEGMEKNSDGSYTISADGKCTIIPGDGLSIDTANTTAGACSVDDKGVVSLQNVDRDGELTLSFKLEAPEITPEGGVFGDEDPDVSISAPKDAEIFYTLDGSRPDEKSEKYKEPFEIEESCTIKAIAVMGGSLKSSETEVIFVFPEIEVPEFKDEKSGYDEIEPQPVVLKNTGLSELVVESVNLEGENKDSFVLSSEKGGKVNVGQSDEKSWLVSPKKGLKPGEYEAEIVFTYKGGIRHSEDISFEVKKK
ncbi:MAG: chitobiase/beta-hexosaminidase C-terminal domain-containing protein [Candidatus Limivicinus sp.]